MQEGRASETAKLSAMMRAAHPIIDPEPHIFTDQLAAPLCGFDGDRAVLAALQSFETELSNAYSPALAQMLTRIARLSGAIRARYASDSVRNAQERGISQYVIVGAGYDSFAYSGCASIGNLRIIEVDHRDTQNDKRRRLKEIGVAEPANCSFVQMDLAKQSLLNALRDSPYRPDEPAIFSLIGIPLYFDDAVISRILTEIGVTASGSEVLVDYLLPEELVEEEQRPLIQMVRAMAASRDEPGDNFISPERMRRMIEKAGGLVSLCVGSEGIKTPYITVHGDELQFPKFHRITHARFISQ